MSSTFLRPTSLHCAPGPTQSVVLHLVQGEEPLLASLVTLIGSIHKQNYHTLSHG